jgi:hypothetical protein
VVQLGKFFLPSFEQQQLEQQTGEFVRKNGRDVQPELAEPTSLFLIHEPLHLLIVWVLLILPDPRKEKGRTEPPQRYQFQNVCVLPMRQ